MIEHTQRWRDRGSSFVRRAVFNASSHHVVEILDDELAKRFVLRHHYSGSYPAARRRFGLYRGADLVGVAVFSEPTSGASKRRWFPGVEPMAVADLGRLVLLDEVAFNGESWFVARCLDRLRRDGIEGVISYSDPMPRERADGAVVTPGHVGIVYQALSAEYAGRTSPEQMHLLPDGTALSRRVVSKIRHGERGRAYGVRMLVRHGATALETADAPAAADDPTGWLEVLAAEGREEYEAPGQPQVPMGPDQGGAEAREQDGAGRLERAQALPEESDRSRAQRPMIE